MGYGQVVADLITTSDGVSSAGLYGFKNKIINGSMQIDQRNAGASVTPNNEYTLDRWVINNTQTSKLTLQQNSGSVTPPAGFTNYIGIVSSSAYSVLAGDSFTLQQRIEGFNVADLAWGTASAATITLSFWVRSSLTGTFGGSLRNSGNTRSYPFTYTISAANTWEQKSITIAGDTSGTWLTTNGLGVSVAFGLGAGSTFSGTAGSWAGTNYNSATGATSVVGTNGATFYITGVQLEKGSTATSFDYRPYGTELQLCQRYLPAIALGDTGNRFFGVAASTTSSNYIIQYYVTPRVAPTGITSTAASNFFVTNTSGGSSFSPTAIAFAVAGTYNATLSATTTAGSPTIAAGNVTSFFGGAGSQILFTGCEL